jgi:hypothetical protein
MEVKHSILLWRRSPLSIKECGKLCCRPPREVIKTAKALGLTIPQTPLAIADVIE